MIKTSTEYNKMRCEIVKSELLGQPVERTWTDIDEIIGKKKGYSYEVYKSGNSSDLIKLYRIVGATINLNCVRAEFKRWISTNGIQTTKLSERLFPSYSTGYLSTILTPWNAPTYPDFVLRDAFERAKQIFSGQPKKELTSSDENQKTIQVAGISDAPLLITNFKTKEQKVIYIARDDFNKFNEFFDAIRDVLGLEPHDIKILLFPLPNQK